MVEGRAADRHFSLVGAPPAAPRRVPVGRQVALGVALFGFWLLLSGKPDLFHTLPGAVTAVLATRYAARLDTNPAPFARRGLGGILRFPAYGFWLAGQILASAVAVARVVLDPETPDRTPPGPFRRGVPPIRWPGWRSRTRSP